MLQFACSLLVSAAPKWLKKVSIRCQNLTRWFKAALKLEALKLPITRRLAESRDVKTSGLCQSLQQSFLNETAQVIVCECKPTNSIKDDGGCYCDMMDEHIEEGEVFPLSDG